jgi:[acyl-carrier-protein] S-malonyltransferase
MLNTEAAILKALQDKGYAPDVTAGLSLGEYGALLAAGVLEWQDAFKLIRKRGIYMQEAVPVGGAMAAVLGLDADKIEAACEATEGIVSIANYNCPGQIVITGEEKAVEAAGEKCKEAGAKRVLPLKVSGPFHSQMLAGAGEQLGKELENVVKELHEIQEIFRNELKKTEDNNTVEAIKALDKKYRKQFDDLQNRYVELHRKLNDN